VADEALQTLPSIPRGREGPVFPAPWAARAFAFTLSLHERGVFSWREWSEALGAALAQGVHEEEDDPETYWRCWLAAMETLLVAKRVTAPGDLDRLAEDWRRAADATPHGQPISPPQPTLD
jgi:nitrile hydratase accessory protein